MSLVAIDQSYENYSRYEAQGSNKYQSHKNDESLKKIIVGGGYGTGREIVQYFTRFGPHGGLLALTVATLVFGLVLSLTFEIGRRFRAYDHRAFSGSF